MWQRSLPQRGSQFKSWRDKTLSDFRLAQRFPGAASVGISEPYGSGFVPTERRHSKPQLAESARHESDAPPCF